MTTDERIEALEKAVRRQRITITALVLVAVAAVVMAGLVLVSLRELRAREAEVAALESAPSPARRTEPEAPSR